jgi:adenine-specific DNA methylase
MSPTYEKKTNMSLEENFDPTFVTTLALREKQIQQNYRPIIGIHKWFARRPGSVFRSLLLSEFNGSEPLESGYWHAHNLQGVIADPFMGGGTTVFEANRLGLSVIGADINPMSYWIVRQTLASLDLKAFLSTSEDVIVAAERELEQFYITNCVKCSKPAKVKYFLWVKVVPCPFCGLDNDLFPGYLLAEATRHPRHVLVCSTCGALNEYDHQPKHSAPASCIECGSPVYIEGPASRQSIQCRGCGNIYKYLPKKAAHPPRHRMWAIEYHCQVCKSTHNGRFFKHSDAQDQARFERARALLKAIPDLPVPIDAIPDGDETSRLHRWGYRYYREMFNERQLLGLGVLLRHILKVSHREIRHALLTIFSDTLRYQNMLCRYDTYALKCQDIFSVHGFPVGLIQCENNLLGISQVGSGSFRHFVEKYLRAKQYCETPFEIRRRGKRKEVIFVTGERIQAQFVEDHPLTGERQAWLLAMPATEVPLPSESLDGVFTDPPYFDNVQYAELMDFCFVWLRLGLRDEIPVFQHSTTRSQAELTGNTTLGRGIEYFTAGLSQVLCRYAAALKPTAPFVFTYHHNDPAAYVPLVVAILDGGMNCTATFPSAAEMNASLHIAGTGSSILDSIFVCRKVTTHISITDLETAVLQDCENMQAANLQVREGDLRCLAAGHIARIAVNRLHPDWNTHVTLPERIARVRECISTIESEFQADSLISRVLASRQNISQAGEEVHATTL